MKLSHALWAYCTTCKGSTGFTPYTLVYGFEAVMPIELEIPSLRIAAEVSTIESLDHRLYQLLHLEENCRDALQNLVARQKQIKASFDKKTTSRNFSPGELVLMWNKAKEDPGKHTKFEFLWIGPFIIHQDYGNNSYLLAHLDGSLFKYSTNE